MCVSHVCAKKNIIFLIRYVFIFVCFWEKLRRNVEDINVHVDRLYRELLTGQNCPLPLRCEREEVACTIEFRANSFTWCWGWGRR